MSGEELAHAFELNITKETKELLLAIIGRGTVNEAELIQLKDDFNLTKVPPNTNEQELLVKLLIQKDYPLRIEDQPSTYRRQTIKHVLNYLHLHISSYLLFVHDY